MDGFPSHFVDSIGFVIHDLDALGSHEKQVMILGKSVDMELLITVIIQILIIVIVNQRLSTDFPKIKN